MSDLEQLASDELLKIAARFARGEFLPDLSEVKNIRKARQVMVRWENEHKDYAMHLKRKWDMLRKLEKEGVLM